MFTKLKGVTFQITVILIFGVNLAFFLPLIKLLSYTHLSFQNSSETSETEYECNDPWRHSMSPKFLQLPSSFSCSMETQNSCQCLNALHEIGNKYQSFVSTLLVCLFLARQLSVSQGLLIHEVSKSHTTTHHSR